MAAPVAGVADEVLAQQLHEAYMRDMRSRGIASPVWIGLPGVIDRYRLVKTSLRIGVGDSLRFLRRNACVAAEMMRSAVYRPDGLLRDIARFAIDPDHVVAGYHLFCFNEVDSTEAWRRETLANLTGPGAIA